MPGLVDTIKNLRANQEAVLANESVADSIPTHSVEGVAKKSLRRSGNTPASESVVGAPAHRRGEDSMSSRPFQYKNLLGMMGGQRSADRCRTEIAVVDEFTKAMQEQYPDWQPLPGHILIPLSVSLMTEHVAAAVKSAGFVNGDSYYDPEAIAYARAQAGVNGHMKAMGTQDYGAGGSLVPNPAFGDLIRLARNTPGLFEAGAQTYPIPPQGAIDFPRIKTATEVDFIDGEGDDTDETELGTDSMKLEAKMVSGIVTLSNKLMMMSMPAAETIVQEDLILSVLLKMDRAAFYGPGGKGIKGIKQLVGEGVTRITPSTVAAAGDTLAPQDWFTKFWVNSAQANRKFTGWIMNPRTYASRATFRADAVTANDRAGLYVESPLGIALEKEYDGLKSIWTNQISANETKGSGTGLTSVFGGPWNEAVFGLFGAVQALINPYETNAYKKQQTKVRVTALGDFNLRYPAAFSFAEQLTN